MRTDHHPGSTKNQSSIDRVNNLPDSLETRQKIFEQGLKEAKRQGLLEGGIVVTPYLSDIKLGYLDSIHKYQYKDPIQNSARAISALIANPKWFAADGIYLGGGKIAIYATATSKNTKLTIVKGSLLESRLSSGLGFGIALTAIENVVQTIAHEVAHHRGYSHSDTPLYNMEYRAIRSYSSK